VALSSRRYTLSVAGQLSIFIRVDPEIVIPVADALDLFRFGFDGVAGSGTAAFDRTVFVAHSFSVQRLGVTVKKEEVAFFVVQFGRTGIVAGIEVHSGKSCFRIVFLGGAGTDDQGSRRDLILRFAAAGENGEQSGAAEVESPEVAGGSSGPAERFYDTIRFFKSLLPVGVVLVVDAVFRLSIVTQRSTAGPFERSHIVLVEQVTVPGRRSAVISKSVAGDEKIIVGVHSLGNDFHRLSLIGDTRTPFGRGSAGTDGGHDQAGQQCDDTDDNKQFDQGKAGRLSFHKKFLLSKGGTVI